MAPYLGTLRDAADEWKEAADALRWFLGPIDIASPEAEAARRRHVQISGWAVDAAKDEDEDAAQRRAIVEAVIAGDVAEFIRIAFALSDRRPDLGLNLVALPGWQRLAPEQKARVRAVAHEYLRTREDGRTNWLGQNNYPYVALAGYQALRLLGHEQGELERLPGCLGPVGRHSNRDTIRPGKGTSSATGICPPSRPRG